MRRGIPTFVSIAIAVVLWPGPAPGQTIDYARDVQPILSDRCYQCHGPDQKARKAKLRLDVREDALAGRDGIHPIVPSVVRQADWVLFNFFRPRFTFSRISLAEAVQTKGFGLALWAAR